MKGIENIGVESLLNGLNPLNERDWEIRMRNILKLGRIETERRRQSQEKLVEFISDGTIVLALIEVVITDSQWQVRMAAAQVLGLMEATFAVGVLGDAAKVARIEDGEFSFEVRRTAIYALGNIGGDDALKIISQLLGREREEGGSESLRSVCVATLRPFGEEAYVELCRCADPDFEKAPHIRKSAIMILGGITFTNSGNKTHSLDRLCDSLKEPDVTIRNAAAYSLGEIGDTRAIGALESALSAIHEHEGETIRAALEKLRSRRDARSQARSLPEFGEAPPERTRIGQ